MDQPSLFLLGWGGKKEICCWTFDCRSLSLGGHSCRLYRHVGPPQGAGWPCEQCPCLLQNCFCQNNGLFCTATCVSPSFVPCLSCPVARCSFVQVVPSNRECLDCLLNSVHYNSFRVEQRGIEGPPHVPVSPALEWCPSEKAFDLTGSSWCIWFFSPWQSHSVLTGDFTDSPL